VKINPIHPWDVDIQQAKIIQQQLQKRIDLHPLEKPIELIAGADVSYSTKNKTVFAGIVIFRYPDLIKVETAYTVSESNFPYIPGYLTFREAPALLETFQKLLTKPDVIIFDGQGIAHPRRLGIATHLGIILNMPTIGCAKSRLIGIHDEAPSERGAFAELYYNNEKIGVALRTRANTKPVYVSPGHKITLSESIDIVLAACTKFRIPEPTRAAHHLVNEIRKQYL
jgi:deoxyribonuclease V